MRPLRILRFASASAAVACALVACADPRATLTITPGADGGSAHLDGGSVKPDAGLTAQADAGPACTSASCDDGNPCTVDACATAGCVHTPAQDGLTCTDDGLFCSGLEACKAGVCASAGDPCPGHCNEAGKRCGDCGSRADCPADTATSWGGCGSFADACAESGTESRSTTTWTCTANQCASWSGPETRACTRTTAGQPCGSATLGACQSCAFPLGCAAAGDGTQTATAQLCQARSCAAVPATAACRCPAQACSGERLLYALPDLAAQFDAGVPTLIWSVNGPVVPLDTTRVALLQTNEPALQSPGWDVGARTGFTEAGAAVRGISTATDASAVQLGSRGLGLYLNTCSPGTSARDGIQPLTVSVDFGGDLRPFADPAAWPELAFRFQAALPTLTQKGGAVAYAAAVLRFRDRSRPPPAGQDATYYDFWLSIQLADTRGTPQPEVVIGDSCPACSGLPIAITAPSGLAAPPRFVHAYPGSDGAFSGAQTFTSWRSYDLRVSTEEFTRIITAVAGYSARGYSTNPADYALVHWNLNPEVYDPSKATGSCVPSSDPDWGTIGMGLRAISISQVPWANLPRIEYTGANAPGTASGLQLFFQRSTAPAFSEPLSLHGTLPATGVHLAVRFNTLANPEWRDSITALRVDPFNAVGNFAVDSLVVYGAGGAELFRDEFTADPNAAGNPWQSSGVSAWAREANGTAWDGLATSVGDPFFWRSVGPLPTGR